MKITFAFNDDEGELVAIGKSALSVDGPVTASYQPGDHDYHRVIERRLTPWGKLAVDIACAELDDQLTIRVTSDDGLVFCPSAQDEAAQQAVLGQLRDNLALDTAQLKLKTSCIFGPDTPAPELSFVSANFHATHG